MGAQHMIAGAEMALKAMGIKNEKQRMDMLNQLTQMEIAREAFGMEQGQRALRERD